MIRRGIFGIAVAVLLTLSGASPGNAVKQTVDLDGVWFACEFAHSRIAPDDDCRMLDDDGFMIAGQKINHIKVRDSQETACRQNRKGNCFRRDQAQVTVESDSAGTFRPTADGFQIKYWGCSQDYKLEQRGGYYQITPVDGLCYWTSDKSYFLARYTGDLRVVEEDTENAALSAEP